MLRELTIFSGPIVGVTDVKCRVASARCSGDECCPTNCIVIPRRGAYVRHVGKRQQLADSTHALFFTAGDTYRVSHPVGLGDDCTALAFNDSTMRGALERVDPPRARDAQPFRSAQVMLSPRTVFLAHTLFSHCVDANESPLSIEETGLMLLHAIVADAQREGSREAPVEGTARRRQRETLDAVRSIIVSNPGQQHSLTQLAQAVGVSPFHLTRLCRRVLGIPLHQYLLQLRLAIALDQIRGGDTTFSRLAFELGFSSHSHFAATFRRTYGVSPSVCARTGTAGRGKSARGG